MKFLHITLALAMAATQLNGCSPHSTTKRASHAHSATATFPIPAHLDINGQTWDLVPVNHFDDPTDYGTTDCDNREIDYVASIDPATLREALWHEVFHAGACIHGGDAWWNSVHPTDEVHPGIYNLADFMHNFTHDNRQFVAWLAEE